MLKMGQIAAWAAVMVTMGTALAGTVTLPVLPVGEMPNTEVRRDVGNSLTIGKRQFDPRWDTLKIVKRGRGEVAHSVVQDVENIRFVISVR